MFHVLCGYLFSRPSNTIDSFDPFNIFQANRLSANPRAIPSLTCATAFGTALALERDAMLRINCEAVMWKITTRGFTLEVVLIMAAMNLLASADTAKREKRKRASQTRFAVAADGSGNRQFLIKHQRSPVTVYPLLFARGRG